MSRRWDHAQRVVMGIAFGVNLHTAVTADHWLRWFGAAACVFVVWVQIKIERHHRWTDRTVEEIRWHYAASSDDPIGALAMMSYLDGLSQEDRQVVMDWARQPEPGDIDDLPPVILGLIAVGKHGRPEEGP